MVEEQWIEQAKQGDTQAFEQLVLKYQDKIYTLAVRMVRDREEASDLAQEAFLRAWQNLGSFQGNSSFGTWLHRLATNVCLDYLRKQTRRQEIATAVSLDDETAGWMEPADFSQDPQRKIEEEQLQQAVSKGLEKLPEHHRRPLVMREVAGLSYQEIAGALNVDLGTVKSRIARARMHLRKILLEDGNLFEEETSNSVKKKRGGESV